MLISIVSLYPDTDEIVVCRPYPSISLPGTEIGLHKFIVGVKPSDENKLGFEVNF